MLGLSGADPDDTAAARPPIDPGLILEPPRPESNDSNSNLSAAAASLSLSCRNSVQGIELIADDRGHVCERRHLESSGCCAADTASTGRYVCASCTEQGCCSVYEHCISCCLHPDKKPLLHTVLGRASQHRASLVYSSVTDQFELCLTKCRTSSLSVLHQNVYRNARMKFCYGVTAPPLDRAV